MGEIWSKKCEQGEDGRGHLLARQLLDEVREVVVRDLDLFTNKSD